MTNQLQKRYNKRAYINGFETNAMIWAHSDKTYIGEQKLFYRKGKWVLLEKSDDGFVELASYTEKQRSEIAKEIEEYNENIREDLFTCIMRHETIGGHDIRDNGDDGWKQTGNRRSGGVYQEESQSNRIGSDQIGEYDIRGNEKIKFDKSSRFSIDDSYLSAVERGDMETAQRMVDDAAISAGAMTLKDGVTKHYYHGTNAKFTSFEAEKARDGTYGFGFYFSPMRSKAGQYGDIKDVYLMTNQIGTRNSQRITADQVNAFVKR